jgi:hypothetical protein
MLKYIAYSANNSDSYGGQAILHVAETGDEPVVVQITGFGPSSTEYMDPNQDPRKPGKSN